jgi:hypothetical protein
MLRIRLNIFESACRPYIKSLTDSFFPNIYESAKNYNKSGVWVQLKIIFLNCMPNVHQSQINRSQLIL